MHCVCTRKEPEREQQEENSNQQIQIETICRLMWCACMTTVRVKERSRT